MFEKKNQMRLQIDLVPLCIMQAEVTKFQKNIPADDKCIHANLLRGIVNWSEAIWKTQNSPFDNTFSNNFSLFQLLQLLNFYKQYIVSIQEIIK